MRFICLLISLTFSIGAYSLEKPNKEEFINWIKTQSPEKLAKISAETTAKALPVQFDSITVLTGIFALGDTITMRIQILKTSKDFTALLNENGKTLNSYIPEFKSMVQNMGCSQEVNAAYIAQGVKYKYIVSDLEFNKLFETYVTSCSD